MNWCLLLLHKISNYQISGHVQVAQVPGRHEPDTDGEINYNYVFNILKKFGDWDVGCEYLNSGCDDRYLQWVHRYGLTFWQLYACSYKSKFLIPDLVLNKKIVEIINICSLKWSCFSVTAPLLSFKYFLGFFCLFSNIALHFGQTSQLVIFCDILSLLSILLILWCSSV